MVVTGLPRFQDIDNFEFQIGLGELNMRWFIATLLASAIQIVTAEDTQYTLKAAGIKAKVSCYAKYYKRLSTWQLVKDYFSLSLTAPRSPTCG